MANAGDYTGYEIDPKMRGVIQELLSGELSQAQQRYLGEEKERGLETIGGQYAGRGAPTGAAQSAQRRYLSDIAMRGAMMAGQQQRYGLQYGLPLERLGAEQYWRPREMELERYRTEQQYQEPAWYEQMLSYAGRALPYVGQYLRGRGEGSPEPTVAPSPA